MVFIGICLYFTLQASIMPSIIKTSNYTMNVRKGEYGACRQREVHSIPRVESLGEFKITFYCSCEKCCGEWAKNREKDENGREIVIGSSGKQLVPNYSVAVDPSTIPYGTKLLINGKEYIAHDSGGAIKGNKIDIYCSSHEEALSSQNITTEVFTIEN